MHENTLKETSYVDIMYGIWFLLQASSVRSRGEVWCITYFRCIMKKHFTYSVTSQEGGESLVIP